MMFLTYTSSSHDYAHRTLGLPRWPNEVLLALTELLGLRSGHAFRITHLHHHRRFPHEDDVEAYRAAQGFWRALATAPGHQARLFLWAWRRGGPDERRWMAIEAGAILGIAAVAVAVVPVAVYAVLVVTSGWLYPVATVWWPHRSAHDAPRARDPEPRRDRCCDGARRFRRHSRRALRHRVHRPPAPGPSLRGLRPFRRRRRAAGACRPLRSLTSAAERLHEGSGSMSDLANLLEL